MVDEEGRLQEGPAIGKGKRVIRRRSRLQSKTGLKRTKGLAFRSKKRPTRPQGMKGVIRYPDGREKCDNTAAGRREYKHRTEEMRVRQQGRCSLGISPLCWIAIAPGKGTFEHTVPKSAGRVDDRIVDDAGNWLNSCACGPCNVEKGSRSLAAVMKAGGNA
jgi:hypothetical protein